MFPFSHPRPFLVARWQSRAMATRRNAQSVRAGPRPFNFQIWQQQYLYYNKSNFFQVKKYQLQQQAFQTLK